LRFEQVDGIQISPRPIQSRAGDQVYGGGSHVRANPIRPAWQRRTACTHDPDHRKARTAELRADVAQISAPQARVLFEASAKVAEALLRSFDEYERQNEMAWSFGDDFPVPAVPLLSPWFFQQTERRVLVKQIAL
jgi:hypothetical protein